MVFVSETCVLDVL